MNKQSNYLQFNIGFIAQESIGYSRDFLFDIPEIRLDSELSISDLHGKVTISRTSEGLLLQAKLSAAMLADCGRCLVEYSQFLEFDFTELLTFPTHVEEDTELVYPVDGNIDLTPLIREHMILAMPITPLCKPDCKGLCAECGTDLNTDPCGHVPDKIDPRLAILKSLLDDQED